MRAAKANQGVRGIAVAKQRAAYFKVEIGLRGSGNGSLPGIEDSRKKESKQSEPGRKHHARAKVSRGKRLAAASEKPDDTVPTPQKIPQMPKKHCQLADKASLCPFCQAKCTLVSQCVQMT